MSNPHEVFVLQTWIAPRTIQALKRIESGDVEGFWLWDLNDIFASAEEAQTCRGEFYFEEDRMRIVKMKLVEMEVVSVHEAEVLETVKPSGSLF